MARRERSWGRGAVRGSFAAFVAGCLTPLAAAQFNDTWVGFAEDPSRLVAAGGLGANDIEEKDYAFGDLDRDGWLDLVCARKEPFSTPGRRPNVLFMNERGVLVDRTAQFAAASDVPGDQGFLTPTNDRDVQMVDLDLDGWLDVVTATTYGQLLSKELSHPRVYVNLGLAPDGTWLGLFHDSARIPQLMNGPSPTAPDFCSVSAGDVTGDGFPDLYFIDYGNTNDRLLINDGHGFFADQTAARMSGSMSLSSGFGTSGEVRDMNGDGLGDLVKDEAGLTAVSAIYNNPANPGHFHIQQTFYSGSGYHMTTGDLNRDARLDVVVTDDGSDRYLYNTGTDPLGRVIWGPSKTFGFLVGSDDGFGGEAVVVDFDGDGWNDVAITDVDVDANNCGGFGRLHLYHNPGGTVGQQITLREEAESSAPNTWRGAVGLYPADLEGTHDIAVFDIDNDGDRDFVLGRCGSTNVWMNTLACPSGASIYCTAKVNSLGCTPEIGFLGVPSATATEGFEVNAHYVRNRKVGLLFYGTGAATSTPFQGGFKCVQSPVLRTPILDSGGAALPADDCSGVYRIDLNAFGAGTLGGNPLPALRVPGTTIRCQFWGRDPGLPPPGNTTLSDALEFTVCP
jgi:hypothetical protein